MRAPFRLVEAGSAGTKVASWSRRASSVAVSRVGRCHSVMAASPAKSWMDTCTGRPRPTWSRCTKARAPAITAGRLAVVEEDMSMTSAMKTCRPLRALMTACASEESVEPPSLRRKSQEPG
jgi:hypothetical protein